MKKNVFILLILLCLLCTSFSVAATFSIEEADQSLAGYYKQQIEYEKWKDQEIQKSQSDYDSAMAYQKGIRDYEKMLRQRAAMAQISSSLNNAMLGISSQMQQIQAVQAQQASSYSQNGYQSKNYSSTNYYNTQSKSSNGYPVLDPYVQRFQNISK
ncbi:MAG: hypothetical protein PHV68_01595 [Candidatus Gastranaerophilales bacterium]|nr:hypothetical protein [Candidatus Gastranaerophilales bacterium]